MKSEKALFFEEERFNQKWNLFLITPVCTGFILFQLYSLYSQLVWKKPVGSDPLSDTWLIVMSFLVIPLMIFLIWLFSVTKLTVQVDSEKILIRFYPMAKREVLINDIDSFEIKEFNPIIDFGGWGLRYSIRWKTTGYIMKGKVGVHIHLKNRKNLLISSERANELFRVLKEISAR
ncbi:MAG: hypothetical protein KGZ42_12380 [Melioribacter sp.]|nr:hypothetical protein [Melioribacter sp.]